MKNNKILYLLTILITLFSFNMKANAAQELTCVYEKGKYGKLILIQHDVNEYEFYVHTDDVTLGSSGWVEKTFDSTWFDWDNLNYKLKNGEYYLTSCPPKVRLLHYQAYFYGSNITNYNDEYKDLEENGEYKEIKIVSPILTETKKGGITEGVSCDTLNTFSDSLIVEKITDRTYDLSCIYTLDISGSAYKVPTPVVFYSGCHVIQMDIKSSGETFVRQNYPFDPLSNDISVSLEQGVYSLRIFAEDINGTTIKNNNSGVCPSQIYVKRDDDSKLDYYTFTIDTTVSLTAKKGYNKYSLKKTIGYNLETGEKIEDELSNIIGPQISFLDCASLFEGEGGENIKGILNFAINIIKMLIPVLLIGLGIADFAKAIFSGAEENMKKIQAKFMKRIILAVCIFLIPNIISFVLEIFNLVWDKNVSTDFCGILK